MTNKSSVRSRLCGAGLLLVALRLATAHAVDNSPTARLTRLADCIGEAGDMKGARREAFMNACLAAKAREAGDPGTGQLLAPEVAKATPSTGLPSQERVLRCAAVSKNMEGVQRTAYLKDCLAGRSPAPSAASKLAQRKAACLAQAKQQPDKKRLAFLDTCLAANKGGTPADTNTAPLPAAPQGSGPRRRAACNVTAGNKQGKARNAFIERCAALGPAASKMEEPAVRIKGQTGLAISYRAGVALIKRMPRV